MPNEETEPVKRKYITRKGEFNDLSVDQMKSKVEDLSKTISDLKVKIEDWRKSNPNPEGKDMDCSGLCSLQSQLKESIHTRVRAYKRIKSLGCNIKETPPPPSA